MQDEQKEGKIDCIPISCLDEMIILPSHKQLASHLSQLIFPSTHSPSIKSQAIIQPLHDQKDPSMSSITQAQRRTHA